MEREPGVPFERTQLAWRRTLLAMGAVAVLGARMAAVDSLPLVVAAAVAVWIAAFVLGRRRIRTPGLPARGVLTLLALATVGYAGLGVFLVLA
ncbi:DUF202 domain-containing protein [Micromonospora sp. CPCC 205371]|nr:DUF202 domain-containing protein [Micromonospora sp. CPCC 205371]